ncbi:MAG TPA: ABC transporter permease, partial [Longimicrobiales bacterium]|nr:ABC transporter permease [Longimicrobiales bacterium]
MRGPPALGRWIVRRLLPPELAEVLEGDLQEGFRSRAASDGRTARLRAIIWFWWQVATVPWWSLGRRERRMGRAGMAGRTGPREGGMGRARRWGNGGMGTLAADVRVAGRTLLRRPAFAVASILTLCLSIGAATLLFSVTEGVLLRPLPYRDPDRIVTIYLLNEEWRDSDNELLRESWDQYNPSRRHIEAFRESPGPLAEVGSWIRTLKTLSRGEVEEEVWGIRVDRGFFPTLGVEPAMGRLPTAREYAEGAPVAVLRDDLWRERFGADPDVLGSTFLYGDRLHTVIGVMPPGFYFPSESGDDFWTPIPGEEGNWVGS